MPMQQLDWQLKHPRMTLDMLGYIPTFLHSDDPRPAREQIDSTYISGWQPFKGFTMRSDGNLVYPGDPPMQLLAETRLRNELIRFYQGSWLAIIQLDGSFEIARLD